MLRLFHGEIVADVSSIQRGNGLEQKDVCLGCGLGLVLHPSRDDQELAFVKFDGPVAEVDAQMAAQDQKELVLVLMVVPDKLALEFDQFDVLPVQLTDDARGPVLAEARELVP